METCPKCRSKRVHRSRTRGRFERLRRQLTGKAPFRCSDCGWRGWAFDFGDSSRPSEGHAPVGPEPDLSVIDEKLQ